MENRSFNQLMLDCERAYNQLQTILKEGPKKGTPAAYLAHQKNINLHRKRINHFKAKLLNFGQGSLIEVSGMREQKEARDGLTYTSNLPFKILLVNTDLDSAERYFKVFMEEKLTKCNLATISFKEIPTGINSIIT